MEKNLVIVESPAKAKTLEKFLGKDFKVMSSYGHIRDLKRTGFSVDEETLAPIYEIPEEKQRVVADLQRAAKQAETVWLASDEDREGEAIAWHLAQVLGLSVEQTKRIVFHEITKPAILKAVEQPRHIDMGLVNAQQARRVLDRIVGFKISPVLWRRIKPHLSAGRVQSVAVRLIVEREREIAAFKKEGSYRVNALFTTSEGVALKAEGSGRFKTEEEAKAFLLTCKGKTFTVSDIQKKPLRRSPAPPFTTSTLQQEAARKLGMSVSQTMSVAQRLYEAGIITYMRTDSVNLSTLCLSDSKKEIIKHLGERYSQVRNYHTKSLGAQEAHEAIRPTHMGKRVITGRQEEKRLYELIWKRTLASQMADAEIEKTTLRLTPEGQAEGAAEGAPEFMATAEVITFDGFLRVYQASRDDQPENEEKEAPIDASLSVGEQLRYAEITATERFTRPAQRYNEAALVHKLEELGIGRPSTYAPTISTIQERKYVERGDKAGEPYTFRQLRLDAEGTLTAQTLEETTPQERNKLLPTDIGLVVNDFLVENFPDIVDYGFTAQAEKGFDEIAAGKEEWHERIGDFYHELVGQCEEVMQQQQEHKTGERLLGNDPETGLPVSVKIGRFGPMVQMGSAGDETKPRFAPLPSGKRLQDITLEEALSLLRLPRSLGEWEEKEVTVGTGRFGPYVRHNGQFVSLPKGADPYSITLDEAVQLLLAHRAKEAARHLKTFAEEPELEVIKGRFGPYISYKGENYRLPKGTDIESLTAQQCLEIIDGQSKTQRSTPKRGARRTTTPKGKKS